MPPKKSAAKKRSQTTRTANKKPKASIQHNNTATANRLKAKSPAKPLKPAKTVSAKNSPTPKTTTRTAKASPKKPLKNITSPVILPPTSDDSYEPNKIEQGYEAQKTRSRNRQARMVREGQDIGAIPLPVNSKRRDKCKGDLNLFYRTYFPDVFNLPWSRVHLKLIKLITMAVLSCAMLAVGIPRGFGKTVMCERAVIWAICYRYHTMIMLFGATNEAAAEMLKRIHVELTTNPLLMEDFPEVCLPLVHVGSANQKGRGQLCQGEPTNVKIRSNELWTGDVLRETRRADGRQPSGTKTASDGESYRGANAAPLAEEQESEILPGACIWAYGITAGGIRGKQRVFGGKAMRPTLGLADDCQTRSSAMSPRLINRRKNILEADLPFLPGQASSWSFLSTWTVIEPDDVADWILNREKASQYHGIRERFLDAMPNDAAMEKWSDWWQLIVRCRQAAGLSDSEEAINDTDHLEPAHALYRKHRKAMDRGAKVVWAHAYDPKRWVSALEKCMETWFRNPLAFYSELQNDPGAFQIDARPQLDKFDVSTRFGLHPRGTCPRNAQWLTVGIDVQGKVLIWSVRAWASDSTSWVVEYGTWPGQNRQYFTLSDIKLTIDAHYSSLPTWGVRLAAALRDLLSKLFAQQWPREDGLQLSLAAGGVDANWKTDEVKAAVVASGFFGKVYPTHGRSFTTANQSLNEAPVRDRDIVGDNWRVRTPREGDVQFATFDTNYFKSQLRDRLMMNIAQPGAMTLHLGPSHDMWADQICAERCHEKFDKTKNREYEEWMKLPNVENHYLDCEVINNVVGSMIGCRLPIGAAAQSAVKAIATMPTSAHGQQTAKAYQPFAKKRR